MIALLDCNNFYASCERIFRPDLISKPVIVLSNNDGCVIARSNEVKKMGINMGIPLYQIKKIVKQYQINLFSSNFSLYGDISMRIMEIIKNDISNVEIYSIDEAFIDFSQFSNYKFNATSLIHKIYKWTGIPTSIGVAQNKTLSKIANFFAKQNNSNFFYIDNSKLKFYLSKINISDVWGIGRQYSKFLHNNHIYNAYDLSKQDDKWILDHFSVNGLKTVHELRGIKCIDIVTEPSIRKNIRISRSFSEETTDYFKLQQVISTFVSKASEKLRKQNSLCSTIHVFIKTNKFKTFHENYYYSDKSHFDSPTNDNSLIIKKSLEILNKIFIPGNSYKQAGIVLGNFVSIDQFQIGLFDNLNQKNRRYKLMKTFDEINNTFGSDAIKLGSEELNNQWRVNKTKLSPSYTTKWNDILTVNI